MRFNVELTVEEESSLEGFKARHARCNEGSAGFGSVTGEPFSYRYVPDSFGGTYAVQCECGCTWSCSDFGVREDPPPEPREDPSDVGYLKDTVYREFGESRFSVSIETSLVRRRDLPRFGGLSEVVRACATRTELDQLQEVLPKPNDRPELYAYEFCSRKKILGYRVWMPPELSRRERYQMLVDVLWEMTWFGWDSSSAEKKRAKMVKQLSSSVKRAEEGTLKTYPAAEVFRRFGLEASTDDYESEYDDALDGIERVLSHNAHVETIRWLADLSACIARGEG